MTKALCLVTALALAAPAVMALEPSWECAHGTPYYPHATADLPWTKNEALKQHTLQTGLEKYIVPKRFTVDLDADPYDRWTEVGEHFAPNASIIVDYLSSFLPDALVPPLLKIFSKIGDSYSGFGEYNQEMHGLADALGIDYGYVVMGNLAYQLERIGVTCSNWNNTGPTGQCPDEALDLVTAPTDDKEVIWLESKHLRETMAKFPMGGPLGQCSSVVAADSNGQIFHARNLDWNLDHDLRELIIDVDFVRGSVSDQPIYTGTTIASFVGVLNGIRYATDVPGETGWSYSMDARCQGGRLLVNLFEALSTGAATPTQHARRSLETTSNYTDGVRAMATGKLIDDAYFIIGGNQMPEGAVVSRARSGAVDVWQLDESDSAEGWWRLETNYDHWQTPPAADDRRTEGNEHMAALGQSGVSVDGLFGVITEWPTFNTHTDFSGIFSPADGTYNSYVWIDNA